MQVFALKRLVQLEAKYGPQPTHKEALLHQIIHKLHEVSVTSVYIHGTVLLPLQVQGNNDMDGANFRAVLYFFLCTDGSELAQKVTTFLKVISIRINTACFYNRKL